MVNKVAHKRNKILLSPTLDFDDDRDDSPTIINKRPYYHYEENLISTQIHFYITDAIGEPGLYTDMLHRIYTATEHDVIFIHLNTPGGQLDTGVQLINAMQNANAKIITVLEGAVHSLGTLLFLSGDEMIVNDNAVAMFHNFRGSVLGKGNEMVHELKATVDWYNSVCKKIYVPFLSEEEVERISRGEDIWLQSEDIRSRLQNMVDNNEQLIEEKAAEIVTNLLTTNTNSTKKSRKNKINTTE